MGFTDLFKIKKYKSEIENLSRNNEALREEQDKLNKLMSELGVDSYIDTQKKIEDIENTHTHRLVDLQSNISENETRLRNITEQINTENSKLEVINKSLKSSLNKLEKSKKFYDSLKYSINTYQNIIPEYSNLLLPSYDEADLELLSPVVELKLNHMNMRDLRKAFRDNDKVISKVLENYSSRYTTKSNRAIYSLMVISLRAELQNILYNLKYEKLDEAIEKVKKISHRYLAIAAEGNQSIAGTLTKFIGEIEHLFINAVKIEYNYYVKKEQTRQEQLAIKEQLRQDAKEREELQRERKRVENEERKYEEQIAKLKEQISLSKNGNNASLESKILELEAQLSNVLLKKEEITKLQHGKAGTVYIISNLGAFGDKVFKIGMTRRLDPQDRINELSSASIPFKYDVHSFIFSDDAVDLEGRLHQALSDSRLNKVNLRKEFFISTIEELEKIVYEIDTTAEFNPNMVAEDYNQSIATNEVYDIQSSEEYSDEEDEMN